MGSFIIGLPSEKVKDELTKLGKSPDEWLKEIRSISAIQFRTAAGGLATTKLNGLVLNL